MIGASGSSRPYGSNRAVEAEIAVDLVGEDRAGRADPRTRAARDASLAGRPRRSGCSDRSRPVRGSPASRAARDGRDPASIPPTDRAGSTVPWRRAWPEPPVYKRVGRHRQQDLAAGVQNRAQRELDPFRRAGRHEHAIRRHRESVLRVFRGDGFASGRNARGRTVVAEPVAERAEPTASTRCGGVLNPNATGSPILRYRTLVPAASTFWASDDDIADGVRKAVDAAGGPDGCSGFRGAH